MNLTLIKPAVAALGTALMLTLTAACTNTLAKSGDHLRVISNNEQSFVMRQENNQPTVYIVGSKVYQWQDLTPQQQEKLKAIEQAMQQVEDRLDAEEAKYDSMERRLEDQAEALEAVAEALENEMGAVEAIADVESVDSVQSRRSIAAQEKILQVKERDIHKQEILLREQERDLQKVEQEFQTVENILDEEFDKHIDEIIAVLEEH